MTDDQQAMKFGKDEIMQNLSAFNGEIKGYGSGDGSGRLVRELSRNHRGVIRLYAHDGERQTFSPGFGSPNKMSGIRRKSKRAQRKPRGKQ